MYHEAMPLGAVAPEIGSTDWSPLRLRLFWVAAALFCASVWTGLGWLAFTVWQAVA